MAQEQRTYEVSIQVAARIKVNSFEHGRLEEKRLRLVVQGALAGELSAELGEDVVHCESAMLDPVS